MRWSLPANIYLFKDNNRNTRKRYEICSKLTIKTYERRHWHDLVLLSLLLTSNIYYTFFYVSIGYYEEGIVCWASSLFNDFLHGRWGWTTEIPIFISLYHFLWSWECSEAAGRICFKKELLFKILQNLQKTTCARAFLNKVRLAKRLRRQCFPVNFSKYVRKPFLQNTSGRLLRRLEKSSWLLVEDIFQPCKFLILIDSIFMGLAMECRNFIFKPFTKERRNSLEFSGICYDMLFMFVIVGKVVNLLLPFATYMNSFYVLFVSFSPCMK